MDQNVKRALVRTHPTDTTLNLVFTRSHFSPYAILLPHRFVPHPMTYLLLAQLITYAHTLLFDLLLYAHLTFIFRLSYSSHILHERSCNHFQWIPHPLMLPRPLKRPQNYELFLGIFFKITLLLFLRALGDIFPWCHRGAIPIFISVVLC